MSALNTYLFIAIGGAFGACLRYFLSEMMLNWLGKGFPFGTLLVNILGSFTLGVLYGLFEQGHLHPSPWKMLIGIGFLGALTTFSTFSMDSILLFQKGEVVKALANVFVNVGACLLVVYLGIQLVNHKSL
ncbi:fluoride efflux transporter CrcB [Algicola sagamiensis]|uniref:fluoride efflux transporter CrcB n=1 Tax=Algicola sagamiensis TaxID=163869 RepID=UPI00036930B4|nr:fluoride efflux transporter CrcB [Algicola sagamiensis]